jgi:hypothetical protein
MNHYEPFDLRKWQENPDLRVVWQYKQGEYQHIRDLTYFSWAQPGARNLVGISCVDNRLVFFREDELFFETIELPEEEFWVWEYARRLGKKHPSESAARTVVNVIDRPRRLWHVRFNPNTEECTMKVVTRVLVGTR